MLPRLMLLVYLQKSSLTASLRWIDFPGKDGLAPLSRSLPVVSHLDDVWGQGAMPVPGPACLRGHELESR
jgi:hypothetical protein